MNHVGHDKRFGHSACLRRSHEDQVCHGVFWGGALVLFGILFLLQHLGELGEYRAWSFWPLLLIMGGGLSLLQKGQRVWGMLMLGFGTLALLNTLSILSVGWGLIWPLAIIAVGIFLVYQVGTARLRIPADAKTAGLVYGTAIMGSKEDRVDSQVFEGGEMTAIMGSYQLDLSEAEMKGEEAILLVKTVMGSVEVRAPAHWRINVQGCPVMGTVEDGTREPPAGLGSEKTLMVQASAVLGSIEIRN